MTPARVALHKIKHVVFALLQCGILIDAFAAATHNFREKAAARGGREKGFAGTLALFSFLAPAPAHHDNLTSG
ncbi:hypothetical protein [Janthinobacterium sp. TND4EL3]|uniref:hypothetical protein n=1 Tax=Janthinobacterium sp. TND4EL3 TaxID=1907311 RepID=UPI001115924A|nr:hypothetical protein [Janthinobacterium sp. TND4EL3]